MNMAASSGRNIEADAAAALIEPLTDLVRRAGAAIMAVNRGSMAIEGKADGSPVTEADFVADRDEFTVNLALVTNGTPLLGIIGAPALGLIWRGVVGRGAERLSVAGTSTARAEPIHTRSLPKPGDPWIAA